MDIIGKNMIPVRYTSQFCHAILCAEKLYKNGYRFTNDGHIQRLFVAALKHLNSDTKMYLGDTSLPSGDITRDSNNISETNHVQTEITQELIRSHAGIRAMIDDTPLPFRKWHLPETGKGQGITLDTVTVYKGANVRVFSQKKPSHADILSQKTVKKTVLVELEIPAYTYFNRESDAEFLKFRFEKAIVKGIYSYPMRAINDDKIIAYSDYDSKFTYIVGEMVKPSKPYNKHSSNACESGIHAFLDANIVWSYFSENSKLLSFKRTEVTVSVITDGEMD